VARPIVNGMNGMNGVNGAAVHAGFTRLAPPLRIRFVRHRDPRPTAAPAASPKGPPP